MARCALTFAVYREATLARKKTITCDVIKLGRDPKAQLLIEDPGAARLHAIIEVLTPDELTLTDLGNASGTRVNGLQVDQCRLKVGDRIAVGATELVLERSAPLGSAMHSQNPTDAATLPRAPLGSATHSQNPTDAATLPRVPLGSAMHSQNPTSVAASPPAPRRATDNPFCAASNADGVVAWTPSGDLPFAARAPSPIFALPFGAADGATAYALIRSGPEPSVEEVERPGVDAVEVTILWGTNVLGVAHLSPARAFAVGEASGADFCLPAEKLGAMRVPLLRAEGGASRLVIPPGATGCLRLPGEPELSLDQARALGAPNAELAGAREIALPSGARARLALGGFAFQVGAVAAGKRLPRGLVAGDTRMASAFGLTLAASALLVGAMAHFVPPLGLTDDEGTNQNRAYLMQQYLTASAERETETSEGPSALHKQSSEGGTGQAARHASGELGKLDALRASRRYALRGKPDAVAELARDQALRDASHFGVIHLLNAGEAGSLGPTAWFGADRAVGNDVATYDGNLWGDAIGESGGTGGLSLSGIGEGAGGLGAGIGLGRVGTVGHGEGLGADQGFGDNAGRLALGYHPRGPGRLRTGATSVSGHLPAAVIQRIIRQNFGRFRVCYEQGLTRNPNLEGRVAARFVIGRDGAVSNVSNGGSDIPDSGVASCVLNAFYGLSFPAPKDGIVTVVYPILFSPG